MHEPLIAGVFGLFIGSFLNVVQVRFGQWRSIATSRSHCPHCKHALAWYDLIPVISFIMLRARCRYCHKPISWQYPIVEMVAAFITYIVWSLEMPNNFGTYIHAIALCMLGYGLLLAATEDYAHMEVPDGIFWLVFGAGIVASVTSNVPWILIVLGAITAAAPFLVLVLVSKETWMGWGDVFIAVPVGMVLAYPSSLIWVWLSFTIGACVGIALLASRLKTRKDPVPFIPMLLAGFLVAYIYGDQMISWYINFFSY